MKPGVVTSLLLLSITSSLAQVRNIKLDEQQGDAALREPSIAINPRNPLNIVATSAMDNVYSTKDGGITWQKNRVSSSLGVDGDATLVADGGGTFYFFHSPEPSKVNALTDAEKGDRIVLQRSNDGGITWDDGVSIGVNPKKEQRRPRVTIDSKGNFTLTWTQFDAYPSSNSNCQSTIMMSTSRNGSKWSEPMVVSQTTGNCLGKDSTNAGAMPAVTFDGKAFVAWSVNNKIYLDRSFDGNLWLSNDIGIMDHRGVAGLKIPGHTQGNGLPVFMTDRSKTGTRGYLFLVWADQRSGQDNTDVWFSRSTNYGDNWSTPLNIGIHLKNHQYMPAMTVDQTTGFIYVVFYDRGAYDDLQTDVVIAWSTDGGNTFKNATISESPFTPDTSVSLGDHINISAHKGVIVPVWARIDNGKTSIWTSVIKHADLEAASSKK